MTTQRIIFVYNAESGLFNSLADYSHKLFSPSTYECNLCSLTYGNLGMRSGWKQFIRKLDTKSLFLRRDEFRLQFGKQLASFANGVQYPVIFADHGKDLRVLVSAKELALCKTLDDLKDLVTQRML